MSTHYGPLDTVGFRGKHGRWAWLSLMRFCCSPPCWSECWPQIVLKSWVRKRLRDSEDVFKRVTDYTHMQNVIRWSQSGFKKHHNWYIFEISKSNPLPEGFLGMSPFLIEECLQPCICFSEEAGQKVYSCMEQQLDSCPPPTPPLSQSLGHS